MSSNTLRGFRITMGHKYTVDSFLEVKAAGA
jgi:hypothetical protein